LGNIEIGQLWANIEIGNFMAKLEVDQFGNWPILCQKLANFEPKLKKNGNFGPESHFTGSLS